jgi:hypothetical protein
MTTSDPQRDPEARRAQAEFEMRRGRLQRIGEDVGVESARSDRLSAGFVTNVVFPHPLEERPADVLIGQEAR